ncbi:MAG: hypothetical protein R2862_04250 [Thermoanaerobaculia bacterium]
MTSILPPGAMPIADMSFSQIRVSHVRYIGAGANAAAGLITLIKTLPTIVSRSATASRACASARAAGQPPSAAPSRTRRSPGCCLERSPWSASSPSCRSSPERGSALKLLMDSVVVWLLLRHRLVADRRHHRHLRPTRFREWPIATLMGTCLLFVSLGWTGDAYQAVALRRRDGLHRGFECRQHCRI